MSISRRIGEYLDTQKVGYEVIHHPQAFTAQEVAHTIHISGKRLAKAVVLKGDEKLVMAVVPASHRLNVRELQAASGAKHLQMMDESDLTKIFPDCELGAIPPFGNLYGMDTWVDRAVSESEEIIFCAGTHKDCLRMKYADYASLTKPQVSTFSELWATRAA